MPLREKPHWFWDSTLIDVDTANFETDSSLRQPGTPLAAATGHDSSLSNLYPNRQSQQKDANSCCNQNSIHIYLTQNLPELKSAIAGLGTQ
jgi:hypothetical protein